MLLAQPSAVCSVVPADAFLPRCTCHALRAAHARRQQGFKHSAASSSITHSALAHAHTTLAVSESTMHRLADGMQLEVVRERAGEEKDISTSPLVFVHGSGHGAWAWQHLTTFMAEQGRDCWAISLRGQGKSTPPSDKAPPATMAGNAADLAHFLATLPGQPIVIGHSFGGLVVQKYLEKMGAERWPRPSGVAFLAAAPPSGNSKLISRIFKQTPIRSLKITWAFITKSYLRSAAAARFLFFSEELPDADLQSYRQQLADNYGCAIVDVRRMKEELPISFPPPDELPPIYVAGATADIIVDIPAVKELAEALQVTPHLFPGAHDMMLDVAWKDVANSLIRWVDGVDHEKRGRFIPGRPSSKRVENPVSDSHLSGTRIDM